MGFIEMLSVVNLNFVSMYCIVWELNPYVDIASILLYYLDYSTETLLHNTWGFMRLLERESEGESGRYQSKQQKLK